MTAQLSPALIERIRTANAAQAQKLAKEQAEAEAADRVTHARELAALESICDSLGLEVDETHMRCEVNNSLTTQEYYHLIIVIGSTLKEADEGDWTIARYVSNNFTKPNTTFIENSDWAACNGYSHAKFQTFDDALAYAAGGLPLPPPPPTPEERIRDLLAVVDSFSTQIRTTWPDIEVSVALKQSATELLPAIRKMEGFIPYPYGGRSSGGWREASKLDERYHTLWRVTIQDSEL